MALGQWIRGTISFCIKQGDCKNYPKKCDICFVRKGVYSEYKCKTTKKATKKKKKKNTKS